MLQTPKKYSAASFKSMMLSKGRLMRRNYELYLFIMPALLFFLIFHYLPIYGIRIAFVKFNPIQGINGSKWVGWMYFERFLNNPNFWPLIKNTLALSLGTLVFGFPISVIWALILNEIKIDKYKRFCQTVSYMPYFISTVVMASMVLVFIKSESGFINKVIMAFGGQNQDYIAKPDMFAGIYVLSGIWQLTGWNAIVYISSLSGVDMEQHEAAMIDGASRLKRIWHINIPHILPTIIIMFIMAVGRIMTVGFEKVFLLQNNLNLPTSEIISTYVYKIGLIQVQYSYSAAVGFFNSVINCLLLLIVNAICRRVGETSLW